MRPTSEIYAQIDEAETLAMEGESKFFGMSYEEGVANALRWVMGDHDEPPMED